MDSNVKYDGLFVDARGYCNIQQWCLINNVNVKKFYNVLRKKSPNFAQFAGNDVCLVSELERVREQYFLNTLEKKAAKSKKLREIAKLKTCGYNFIKLLISEGADKEVLDFVLNKNFKDLEQNALAKDLTTETKKATQNGTFRILIH